MITASAHTRRSPVWIDAAVILGAMAVVFGAGEVAAEWNEPLRPDLAIDLSPWALPKYALFSLARGWIAYFFSLVFTLVVASWAFYDARARRLILPALDVLQSVPVLGFLPGLVLALVSVFPHSNVGIELACVLMIFTGQVWNMVFSYYDSLRAVPEDYRALGRMYGFSWWHRFAKVELPSGAQGLLFNSMVSMAGGWFFLSITEAFKLGHQDFRVPGIGSYMSVAIQQRNVHAQLLGVIAMGVVIIAVDRLVWWPLVVWSRKFRLDDFAGTSVEPTSMQRWLSRSHALQSLTLTVRRAVRRIVPPPRPPSDATAPAGDQEPVPRAPGSGRLVYHTTVFLLLAGLCWGGIRFVLLIARVPWADWLDIVRCAGLSLLRVLAAVALGTLWTVPVAVWIGLKPNVSKRMQPLIQFVASFPSPMLYPWILTIVLALGGTLQWGAVPLMMMGTQWYILFNAASAAAAIPNDLVSCADLLKLSGWERWRKFLLPAIFPGLVTGWITATGGAWNATIVSEYIHVGDKLHAATGLGALISHATDDGNFPKLSAAVLVMAAIVVGTNRTLWKRLQNFANERCRFIT